MSIIEKAILIVACLVPLLAFFLILPKILKNRKSKKLAVKVEQPVEPPKEEIVKEQPIPKATNTFERKNLAGQNGFKEFLNQRKTTRPVHKETDLDLPPFNSDFESRFRRPRPTEQETKPLAEQINELSPELKALLFSGALSKKDID